MRQDTNPSAQRKEAARPNAIDEWCDVEPAQFTAEISSLNRPAVLRRAAEHWPLVERGKRSVHSLVEHLIRSDNGELVNTSVAPPEANGRLVYKEDRKELNHRCSPEKLPNVLKGLLKLMDEPQPPGIWIGGLKARDQMPDIEDEFRTELVPPGTPAHMWIGNAVTIPPHFDAADNLAFVVAGRRRFTVFPPDQVANLYVGPMDVTPSGVPISMVAHDAPDLERYPRYSDALASAYSAELGPGDAIYIPYLWWHGVQSLDRFNMLVNFWWYSDGVAAEHPHGALLRATYELFRNMPAEHRRAWQRMYEYWAFQAHGNPEEHLPKAQETAAASLHRNAIAQLKVALSGLLSSSALGGDKRT